MLSATNEVARTVVGRDVSLDNERYQAHRRNEALVVTNDDPL